jgi:hypothetical protein
VTAWWSSVRGVKLKDPGGVGSTPGDVLSTGCASGAERTVGMRSVVRNSSVASGRDGEVIIGGGDDLALAR